VSRTFFAASSNWPEKAKRDQLCHRNMEQHESAIHAATAAYTISYSLCPINGSLDQFSIISLVGKYGTSTNFGQSPGPQHRDSLERFHPPGCPWFNRAVTRLPAALRGSLVERWQRVEGRPFLRS